MSESTNKTPRKIIGLSLPPEMAQEVKQEAAARGMTMRKLFEEMWSLYSEKRGKASR